MDTNSQWELQYEIQGLFSATLPNFPEYQNIYENKVYFVLYIHVYIYTAGRKNSRAFQDRPEIPYESW